MLTITPLLASYYETRLLFSITVLILSFLIRVDKNADGRIGEEEVKEVSNKHPCPWLCLELVVLHYKQFLSLFFRPFFF